MADEISIKDIVTLFQNELRTKEQLESKLLSSSKEDLAKYIIDELEMDDMDNSDLTEETDGNSESNFDY